MPLEFLESVQYFRRSEGEARNSPPPPPSGARYKNTPVGRGLISTRCLFGSGPSSAWRNSPLLEARLGKLSQSCIRAGNDVRVISFHPVCSKLRLCCEREAGAIPLSSDTRALLTSRQAALSRRDRDIYKQINRECRVAIRLDTRKHYERQVKQNGRNKFWQILRPLVGSKKNVKSHPINVTPDALNDYYISIGPVTVDTVPATSALVPTRLPRVHTGSLQSFAYRYVNTRFNHTRHETVRYGRQ